jgi:hypothetical protein
MTKYIVPIDAWITVEAPDSESAWTQAVNKLSSAIGNAIDLVGEGGVSFGEPELEDPYEEDDNE